MSNSDRANAVSPRDVQDHVAAILASKTFASSARLSDFLRYVTDRHLRGLGSVKEHELATSGLGFSEDFDSLENSVVRVHASRLRQKLKDYYQDEAPPRKFEVRLARGSYVLEIVPFESEDGENKAEPPPTVPQSATPAIPEPAPTATSLWWPLALAASLLAVTIVGIVYVSNRPSAIRLERITEPGGLAGPSKFSADGKTILFGLETSADSGLRLYSIDAAQRGDGSLIGYPGQKLYSVSSNGLLFLNDSDDHRLSIAPSLGSPLQPIAHSILSARWDKKGSAMLVVHQQGLEETLEYPMGTVLARASSGSGRAFQFAILSPSGRWIAYGRPSQTSVDYDLCVLDRNDGSIRVVSPRWTYFGPLAWSPRTEEILIGGLRRGEEPGLFAIKPTGESRLLLQRTQPTVIDDVREDGAMLVREIVIRQEVMGDFGDGKGFQQIPLAADMLASDLSKDGKTLVLSQSNPRESANDTIYLLRIDGKASPAKVTKGVFPVLSPDGRFLLVIRESGTTRQARLIDLRTMEETDQTVANFSYRWPTFSPDGDSFLFNHQNPGNPSEFAVFRQHLYSRRVEQVTAYGEYPVVSLGPSGDLAFPRGDELFIRSAATGTEQKVGEHLLQGMSLAGAQQHPPAPLLASKPDWGMSTVTQYAVEIASGTKRKLRQLDAGLGGSIQAPIGLTSADGSRMVYSRQRQTRTLYLLSGLGL